MIRPTRRAVLVFAAGIPPALVMLAYDPGLWPFSFDCGLMALLAIAFDALRALPSRELAIEAVPPARIYIGERDVVSVRIKGTRAPRPVRLELLLEAEGEIEAPQVSALDLEPGDGAVIGLPLVPRRRGRIVIACLWLRWQGPLGLVRVVHRLAIDRGSDVVPNTRAVRSAALEFYAQEALFGMKVQQQKGEGAEFDALRDYAPGLDSRYIDWKHSARHNKLLCKEFKTERNHPVILAFDTGYLMAEPIAGMPRLDHAINSGLLLAWIALQSGDLVGTFGFDAVVRQYRGPIRGASAFAHIQRATADLEYRRAETNFTLGLAELGIRLKRRALVILFTDFVDTVTAELLIESAGRIASRHVMVFVTLRDPLLDGAIDAAPRELTDVAQAVIAHDFLRDRGIVLERLARLGIHCLDVGSGGLSPGLVNRYLRIKQRGLL